jgi:hypothetical protein
MYHNIKQTILKLSMVFVLFFANRSIAQVGIGVVVEIIHPSAALEVKSTTKGFLPPRMTQAERDAIVAPAAGLLIYQTDGDANNTAGLYYFDGSAWKNGMGVKGKPGPKGDKGEPGMQGLPGGVPLANSAGEMKYWDGINWNSIKPGNNGQRLTLCDGIPTWTTGGTCPTEN